MLIEFEKMNEQEMYRMVREVYLEGCIENAREKYPEREDLTEAIREEEDYFVGFLKRFMGNEKNRYYVWEADGKWVSALRLTKLDGFYYLEALETAPEHRRNGYAETLINEVISSLKKRGQAVIRSNVNKSNAASLATHKKCGFRIELENGVNCLTGEERDYVYGMIYEGESK